jgi:hypothetical protein
VLKAVDLKVNRMEIAGTATDGESDNWIEWEAKSGFITADSGATYTVKNDAWDPNIQDGSLDVTPSAVEMTRLPEGGTEQRWSYVWNSGVKVYTDLATGEVIRRTLIMSEGPANGKLRKREVLKDGKWTLDRQNSYDPKGRPVRAVHGDDMRIWKWEEIEGGASSVTQYLNGAVKRIETLSKDGSLVYRETYREDGSIEFFRTNVKDGRRLDYFYSVSPSVEALKQSLLIDRETVFLANKDGAFEFLYDGSGKRSTKLLSSRDPRFIVFKSLIGEAFSL